MTSILEFCDVTWKGVMGYTVRGNICAADPSVGIMSPHLDCPEVISPEGEDVTDELTDDDLFELGNLIQPRLEAYYYGCRLPTLGADPVTDAEEQQRREEEGL